MSPNKKLDKSRKNLGHVMAIFPLGLITLENGSQQEKTIQKNMLKNDENLDFSDIEN